MELLERFLFFEEALQGIPFDKQSSEFITVGQSVTEFEVRLAIALDPSMRRCAWVHRELSSPAPSLLKRITERDFVILLTNQIVQFE